jgi:O-antigen/teichoic acid export membrane protein
VSAELLDTPDAGPAAIRGGVLRVVGYLAGVMLSVGSAALLFRHLGVDDSGRYVTALSIVAIVGGISDVGLTAIGVREMSVRDGSAGHDLMRNLIGLRIALTTGGVAIAVVFTALAGYPSVLVAGVAVAGIGLIATNVQATLSTGLLVDLRLGWVTILEFLRQVVSLGAIVLLVAAGAGLVPFLAVPILAGGVVLVLTAGLVRGRVPLRPRLDPVQWRPLVREILPFAGATAIGSLYFRVAIIVLSLTASTRETGLYGAAFRVVDVLVVVPQMMVGGALPIFARAARDDRERLGYAVQRTFEVCVLVGGLAAVVLLVGAPFVIDVVAGPKFAPAADVLRVQAVTLAAAFAGASWGYALLTLHLYRALLKIAASALAINVGLVLALAPAHGSVGAAFGTLVADLYVAVATGVVLARAEPSMRPSLGQPLRVLLAMLPACALAFVTGVPSALMGAAAAVLFIALAMLFRAVPGELFAEGKRLLGRGPA